MENNTNRTLSNMAAVCLIGACIGLLLIVVLRIANADTYQDTPETLAAEVYEENEDAEISVEAPLEPSRGYFDVPLDNDLQDYIMDICEDRGIEPAIAFSIIKYESGFDPNAVGDHGNSIGLMQVQPRWHYARMNELGVSDLTDPYQNVTVGLDLFADLLDQYGSVEYALMAYNGGSAYATRMIRSGRLSSYVYGVVGYADSMTMLEN